MVESFQPQQNSDSDSDSNSSSFEEEEDESILQAESAAERALIDAESDSDDEAWLEPYFCPHCHPEEVSVQLASYPVHIKACHPEWWLLIRDDFPHLI